MADSAISQYLKKIMEAVYGEDVRTAIHNAISQCYNDVNNPVLTTKAIAAAVQEKIDDGTIPAMVVPLATPDALGGIKADARTSDDILNVRLGDDGHLYAESPSKAIRFKNLTRDWGDFRNSSMVRDVDYSLTGDKANDTGVGFDETGLHLAQGVTFKTLSKESDLNPILGHKYWLIVKANNNTYGGCSISLRNVKNVSYDHYDEIVSASISYSTNTELPIKTSIGQYSVQAKPNVENTFYLYSGSNYSYYPQTIQYVMLYDLTDSFGTGNEPTASELETLFNKIYGTDIWEYNSGTITFELGGDGSKTVENVVIPDDVSGESGGSGDAYLKGKSLYVIGDSLTAYSDWGKSLCAAEGMTWYNWGFAGTTMAAPETPDYESGHTGVERVRQLPHDNDYVMENMVVLIWLGINDKNLGSGVDETSIQTLYGGLNDVLNYLTTTFPVTPIGIMGLHKNSNSIEVTSKNEVMKAICKKYSVPFFDVEAEGRIIPSYLSDGLHLGVSAIVNIRRRIRQWIKTL